MLDALVSSAPQAILCEIFHIYFIFRWTATTVKDNDEQIKHSSKRQTLMFSFYLNYEIQKKYLTSCNDSHIVHYGKRRSRRSNNKKPTTNINLYMYIVVRWWWSILFLVRYTMIQTNQIKTYVLIVSIDLLALPHFPTWYSFYSETVVLFFFFFFFFSTSMNSTKARASDQPIVNVCVFGRIAHCSRYVHIMFGSSLWIDNSIHNRIVCDTYFFIFFLALFQSKTIASE